VSKLNIAIELSAVDHASSIVGKLHDALGGLGGIAGGLATVGMAAATAGVAALGAGLVVSIGEAMKSQDVMAQTAAVIKSTGDASGETSKQIAEMAAALSTQSRFSHDSIQTGENLLLTFTNIGKDVFPQATQAMVDMATAMGTDASGGAIQLGKALNDPTQGITALTRVGVTFSDEQKKLIKHLQETGNVAGAQKVILAELAKEFGGSAAASAKTFGGQLDVMKNALLEVAGAIGGPLLTIGQALIDRFIMPAIPVVETLGNTLAAMLTDFVSSGGDLGVVFDDLREGLSGLVPQGVLDALTSLYDKFTALWSALSANDPTAFFNSLSGLFSSAASGIGPMIQQVITAIQNWIVTNGPVILATLQACAQAFIAWIGPMIPPLLVEIGRLEVELVNWIVAQVPVWLAQLQAWGQQFVAWIAPMIPPLLAEAQKLAAQLLAWLGAQVPPLIAQLVAWGQEFVAWVGPQIPPLLTELGILAGQLLAWLGAQVPPLVAKLLEWATEFVAWVGPQIPPLLIELGKLLGQMTAWIITTGVPGLVEKIKEWATAFMDWVMKPGGAKDQIIPALGKFLKAVGDFVTSDLVPGFIGFAKAFVDGLLSGFNTNVPDLISRVTTIGSDIMGGVKAGINGAIQGVIDAAVGGVKSAIAAAWAAATGGSAPSTTAPVYGPPVPQYASGASFDVPSQFTNDSYWMRVSAGEHVDVTPAGRARPGGGGSTTNYYINATYRYQPERSLADDIRQRALLKA